MPYKTDLHASLPYVDKQYKELLDKLALAHKRDLKHEIEFLISDAAHKAKVSD